ncbi:hypothetical protein LXA43DRAFT_1064936 [Ganoderma leucocontextum]|nr:hypothetical protein LXA43DRAFT_1064936 [Ganoderma leucocontextum]
MAYSNTVAQTQAPLIPIEVFENVIDSLYSTPLDDQLWSSDALRSCALMMLFYSVVLSDVAALYRFSSALDFGHHLSGYVRELILTGRYLHTTTSIVALFSSVLRGKVPNLRDLHVVQIPEDADWYPESPQERRRRDLHGFLAIKHLHLENVTLHYFSDFVRIIYSLRDLQSPVCYNIRWITLGVLPACMAQHEGRTAPQPPFAPELEELLIKSLGIYGAERLVSSLGSGLVELQHHRGNWAGYRPEPLLGTRMAVHRCQTLANPSFLTYDGSSDLVNAMLHSWHPKPSAADPVVIFFTNDAQAFTRQAFVDVLRALGRITEDWFQEVSHSDNMSDLWRSIKVRVYDWEEWRVWWWGHVQALLPDVGPVGAARHGLSHP